MNPHRANDCWSGEPWLMGASRRAQERERAAARAVAEAKRKSPVGVGRVRRSVISGEQHELAFFTSPKSACRFHRTLPTDTRAHDPIGTPMGL
jgi:hypothetical protein